MFKKKSTLVDDALQGFENYAPILFFFLYPKPRGSNRSIIFQNYIILLLFLKKKWKYIKVWVLTENLLNVLKILKTLLWWIGQPLATRKHVNSKTNIEIKTITHK